MFDKIFKRKPKIEFVSLIDGVADAYPVIPASAYKPKWTEAAYKEYKELKQQNPAFNHITLCPGIFDMFKTGFIIPAWHDLLVRTNGDHKTFQWAIPEVDSLDIEGFSPIGSHMDELTTLMPKRPHSLKGVLKFNTPWRIIAPKGIKFLMLPVPYDDQQIFESSMGILNPAISNEINIQVHWNALNSEEKIKAGTPLCYMLPITDKDYELVVRTYTDHDLKWEKKKSFVNSSTFFPNRNKLANMYYKHFKT